MTNSSEYKNINTEMLNELAGDDSNFISELISIFLEDVPKSSAQMLEYFANSDFQGVASQAHKLKASTRIIGAQKASNLVAKIEAIAKLNNNEKVLETMLSDLNITLDNCYEELSNYRSQLVG